MAWNLPGKGGDKGGKDPWKGRDPDRETDAFLDRLKQGMGRMFGGESGDSDNGPRFAIRSVLASHDAGHEPEMAVASGDSHQG